MTITNSTNKSVFAGNGAQTAFTFSFNAGYAQGAPGAALALALSYLTVIATDASGNQTVVSQGSGLAQCRITLNPPAGGALWGIGGTVNYNPNGTPLPLGSTLTVFRTVPLTQLVSLSNQGGLFPQTVEMAMDLLEFQIQQIAEAQSRVISAPIVDPSTINLTLPAAAQRANTGLAFDSSGNVIAGTAPASGLISSAMQPVVDAATLAIGRSAFGLGSISVENVGAAGSGIFDDGSGNAQVRAVTAPVATDQAPTGANHFTTYIATGPINFNLARANTLFNGYGFSVRIISGTVTFAPNASDAINKYASGLSRTVRGPALVTVFTDGASAGTWYMSVVTTLAGYNVVDFGAVGDGVTDDSVACQAAINAATAAGGGTVYFPAGSYAIGTALTINAAVKLVGGGGGPIGGTVLFAGPRTSLQDHPILIFTNQWASAENMVLYGCGAPIGGNVPSSFGATQPVVKFASGAVSCALHRLYIWGGGFGIFCAPGSGDNYIVDCFAAFAYQSAVFYAQGCSVFLERCKFDQDWPVSEPSGHPTFQPWAASTGYAIGSVVSTQNYFLQCSTTGVSGSVAPTLKNYTTPISDGGAVWKLVGGTGYFAYQFDTGVPIAQMDQCDCSGCFFAGIATTNSLSGTPPSNISIDKTTPGQNINAGVLLNAGNNVTLTDMNIGGPVAAGTAGIKVGSTWGGDLDIKGGVIAAGVNGIELGGGLNTTINAVRVAGMSGSGIFVDANVSNFAIEGCLLGGSSSFGPNTISVSVAVGASNNYIIANNIISGSGAVSDGGSGTNKTVGPNR